VVAAGRVPDGLVDLVARRLWVVGEPTRVRLLLLLEGREAGVQELADELGSSHQRVSKHLRVLHSEGLLSRRADGNQARYTVCDFTIPRIVEQIAASVSGRIEELVDLAELHV
jgi:DNA-binding transcriptional ArsR family regulator